MGGDSEFSADNDKEREAGSAAPNLPPAAVGIPDPDGDPSPPFTSLRSLPPIPALSWLLHLSSSHLSLPHKSITAPGEAAPGHRCRRELGAAEPDRARRGRQWDSPSLLPLRTFQPRLSLPDVVRCPLDPPESGSPAWDTRG